MYWGGTLIPMPPDEEVPDTAYVSYASLANKDATN